MSPPSERRNLCRPVKQSLDIGYHCIQAIITIDPDRRDSMIEFQRSIRLILSCPADYRSSFALHFDTANDVVSIHYNRIDAHFAGSMNSRRKPYLQIHIESGESCAVIELAN